jgi:hypothetical protein
MGVCMIDGAKLLFNGMRTGDDDYTKLRNLANIIEKSNICLIFNAYSTTLLNNTPTESTMILILIAILLSSAVGSCLEFKKFLFMQVPNISPVILN